MGSNEEDLNRVQKDIGKIREKIEQEDKTDRLIRLEILKQVSDIPSAQEGVLLNRKDIALRWLEIFRQVAKDKHIYLTRSVKDRQVQWIINPELDFQRQDLGFKKISEKLKLPESSILTFLRIYLKGKTLDFKKWSFERMFFNIYKNYKPLSLEWVRIEGYFKELYALSSSISGKFGDPEIPTGGSLFRRLGFEWLYQIFSDLSTDAKAIDTIGKADSRIKEAIGEPEALKNFFKTGWRVGDAINFLQKLRRVYDYYGIQDFDTIQQFSDRLINMKSSYGHEPTAFQQARKEIRIRNIMMEQIRYEVKSFLRRVGLEVEQIGNYFLNLIIYGERAKEGRNYNSFVMYFKYPNRERSPSVHSLFLLANGLSQLTADSFLSVAKMSTSQKEDLKESLPTFKEQLLNMMIDLYVKQKFYYYPEEFQRVLYDRILLFSALLPIVVRVENPGLDNLNIQLIEDVLELNRGSLSVTRVIDIEGSLGVMESYVIENSQYINLEVLDGFNSALQQFKRILKESHSSTSVKGLLAGGKVHHRAYKPLLSRLFHEGYKWVEDVHFRAERQIPGYVTQADLLVYITSEVNALLSHSLSQGSLSDTLSQKIEFLKKYKEINFDYHSVEVYARLLEKYGSNEEIAKHEPEALEKALKFALDKVFKDGYQIEGKRALAIVLYGTYSPEVVHGLTEYINSKIGSNQKQYGNFVVMTIAEFSDTWGFSDGIREIFIRAGNDYNLAIQEHPDSVLAMDRLSNFMNVYSEDIDAAITSHFQRQQLPPNVLPRRKD